MKDRFHVFAHEDSSNVYGGNTPIEIACDASLDEGAIIRTVAPHDSIGASRTQYFVGLERHEAEILLHGIALMQPDGEQYSEDLTWLRERIARIPAYAIENEVAAEEIVPETVTLSREVVMAALEPLRLAHVYALKETKFDKDLGEDFKPWKWDGYEREYAECATSAYRNLINALTEEASASSPPLGQS